ncbi:MAG: ferritin-like domain-containing protein, partial [Actinomycetota bacterium]|nr:ferritin-like domain-containing protein [Actinomycetota bacterium]
ISATISDLGGEPVKSPRFRFPDGVLDNRDAFLETASVFEELGVTAYHGQVTAIENGDILAAAAAIAGVESRHAAIIAQISGGNPFPAPMEATATMDEVLEAAMQFIRA